MIYLLRPKMMDGTSKMDLIEELAAHWWRKRWAFCHSPSICGFLVLIFALFDLFMPSSVLLHCLYLYRIHYSHYWNLRQYLRHLWAESLSTKCAYRGRRCIQKKQIQRTIKNPREILGQLLSIASTMMGMFTLVSF